MANSNLENVFCPLPWVHLSTRTSGDARVCCNSWHGPGKGMVRDENQQVMNVSTHRLDTIRNSRIHREIRKDLLAGKRSPHCTRCWQEEDMGVYSMRQAETHHMVYEFSHKDAQQITNADGSLSQPTPLRTLDLRLGNMCNLKCMMCGPTESSAWFGDYAEVFGRHSYRDLNHQIRINPRGRPAGGNPYLWYKDDRPWQEINHQLPNLRKIYIAGGEPMLVPEHKSLLQECVNQNFAKNIALEYNINCTHLDTEILEMWPVFRSVSIGCSIDGYKEVNEYVRYPSKWPVIERNYEKILSIQSENIHCHVSATLSAWNISRLPEFLDWLNLKRDKQEIRAQFHFVFTPLHANPLVLPAEARKIVLNRILTWKASQCSQGDWSVTDSVIQLFKKGFLAQTLDEFKDFTQKIDRKRSNSFAQVDPEIHTSIFGQSPQRLFSKQQHDNSTIV